MPVLNVALLWHMHQPDYRDPETGMLALPWVRLHATKGYYDMVKVLERGDAHSRACFSFTPSLVSQLQGYVDGTLTDKYLELSTRPASDLSADERRFITSNFFHANRRTMIDCYPRYSELRTMSRLPSGIVRDFSDRDLTDLVVWFNLTWFGYSARAEFPFLMDLIRQGKGYSDEQKLQMLALQRDIIAAILPAYRNAAEQKRTELTTTPFYHPILPLVCTTDSAKAGLPDRNLPVPPFVAPEDARHQVRRAIELHEAVFGSRPDGMWPAEGSVSTEAVQIITEEVVKWIASDQDVLFRSNPSAGQRDLYVPYFVGEPGRQLSMVFRDKSLADKIGFRYSGMTTDAAVNDFMDSLRAIWTGQPKSGGEQLVTIVLDGENAWEYYPDGGEAFLTAVYSKVANSKDFRWTTISEYLARNPPRHALRRIFPGSWINGDFDIWIGSNEENRAWEALRDTRSALVSAQDRLSEKVRQEAWEHIYIAEGSDWFWWYGDDFTTALQGEFDRLFRAHLAAVFELINAPVPAWLVKPIRKGRELAASKPVSLISPTLDGRSTSYYEWAGAGHFDTRSADGAMAREAPLVSAIAFGADHYRWYLRIDWSRPLAPDDRSDLQLVCVFPNRPDTQIIIGPFSKETREIPVRIVEHGTEVPITPRAVFRDVVECAVPFLLLGAAPGTRVEFVLSVRQGDNEIERWPRDGVLAFDVPTDTFELEHWTV
ncbi:MAG TPA: glycoside hydrolase family 57 protein [Candidatus Latescibacteria bacterium]|nr:glycoside hydrolase family 57 protein [Candidatus Latescibacterota bacterium]